jgi:hypothetical protein
MENISPKRINKIVMNKEQIKQKINNHIDYRRLLWTTFIVLSSGIFTLMLKFWVVL